MKKIKSLFAVVILAAFTSSCTKEEALTTNEVQNQSVMRFASEKEMNDKIAEIEAFKKNQEDQILQKILVRNNLSAPTLQDVKNASKKELTEADKTKVLEDVKFYHQEKLKAIYAERAHFGFTSIQSIADEINFSKVLNTSKAEKLKKENSNLIITDSYFSKVNTNSNLSLISNVNGIYVLKSKTINLDVISQENNQNNRLTGLKAIKEGILSTNGFYSVTYHVGYSTHRDDIGFTFYGSFTQYGSFVNGALYPSWFYTNPNSSCSFSPYGSTLNTTVPFISSAGDIVRNDVTINNLVGNTTYNTINSNFTNQVSGTYITPINGQFITITGFKNLNQ